MKVALFEAVKSFTSTFKAQYQENKLERAKKVVEKEGYQVIKLDVVECKSE